MKKIIANFMLIVILFSFSGCNNDDLTIDRGTFSDSEVVEYLQNQGFEFSATEGSTGSTKYIYVSHEDSEIVFQKITNTYVGVLYSWRNGEINGEWAEMKSTYENDTEDERKQFNAYEKWLKYHNLTSKQVTDALDYFETNVDEYEKMPSVKTCNSCDKYIVDGYTHICDE